jgi:GST-like protein
MIDLYTWNTPNGRKVSIMLEEIELPYETHAINIAQDEQFTPEFLAISPNNKIPAIVDRDNGRSMMESGAILMYLAEKAGQLLPSDEDSKWRVIEWLMMQMGSVGPMLGQTHHFVKYNQGKAPYAEDRYLNENKRIYGVLDRRLGECAYLAGDDYTIADVATFPWIARWDWQTMDLNETPNIKRWYLELAARPAVQRGFDIPSKVQDIPIP